jgi:hypothetical protein
MTAGGLMIAISIFSNPEKTLSMVIPSPLAGTGRGQHRVATARRMMAAPISKQAITHAPLRACSPAKATQPTASVLRKGRTVQTSGNRRGRIASRAVVGQTAHHDIAGKEPAAVAIAVTSTAAAR